MRRRLGVAAVGVIIATSACSAASGGCTDDYAPASRTSCSYNPVYAGLVRERGANVAENWVRTESGTSGVYLIVDPPDVSRGEPVRMSVLNTSGVDLQVGPAYTLDWFGRRNKSFVRDCSIQAAVTAPAGEESDVFEVVPCRGNEGGPLPLGYYSFILDVAAEGDELPGGFSSRFRFVR